MEPIIIEASFDKPKVILNHTQQFEISGRSFPENANLFYAPIISWLKLYAESPNSETNFKFHFELLSSSSTKQIMKVILLIDEINKNHKINIFWYYDIGDTDMLKMGEILQKEVAVPFSFKEI
jgi:hypothetical protein